MKTEDLKNYIFEQCLTEAKMHPLVMRGAQWVVDQIGGYDGPDAKKLADRMNRGIKRTTNKPTAEHVYNAAQFHYGEILRKHSPGMDRPEVYANMRKQLRAHLGLDGEVNETSDLAAGNLADRRRMQAIGNYDRAANVGREMVADYRETGIWDPDLQRDRKMFSSRMDKAFKSAQKAENRRRGKKGDGSPRTSTQESAFNFINGLKRLQENSRRRKNAKDSAEQKRYGWTMKDSRVQDYADKMYPEPDDVSEFENEQLQGRRIEAEHALRRRENPHDIKKNIRDMLFTIKK